jgi:ferric-dicitrate binding protein FerR (iron transport regulator)
MGWVAVAASFLLVVMLMATVHMPTAYAMAKGEMRTVPLGGGTTVVYARYSDTPIVIADPTLARMQVTGRHQGFHRRKISRWWGRLLGVSAWARVRSARTLRT